MQGFAQSYNAAHQRALQIQLDQRHALGQTLATIYADPNTRPEAKTDAIQRILQVYSTPIGKKLDKKIGDISTLGQAAMQGQLQQTAAAGSEGATAGQAAAFPTGAPVQQGPQLSPQPPMGIPAPPDIGAAAPTTVQNPAAIAGPPPQPAIPPPPSSPFYSPAEKIELASRGIEAEEAARVHAGIAERTRIADSIPGLTPEQRANVISGHMLIPTGRGQVKTVVGPDGQPMTGVFDPIQKQFTDLQGNVLPPNTREWKAGGGGFWGRTTPQMAAVGPPPNPLDTGKYPGGTKDPQFVKDVQDYGQKVNALILKNQTTAASARGESYAYGRAKYMQVPVLARNAETGEPEATFASPLQIASDPSSYTPLVEGDKLMMKNAVFEDINGAAKNLRSALQSNPVQFSVGQIAALTAAMDADPSGGLLHSTITNLIQSGGKNALSPEQQSVAIAMQQAYENAYALRGVAGFGSGSDELRRAIRATLPGPSSPKDYALKQLTAFEQQVARLRQGVVSVPLRSTPPPSNNIPAPPSGAKSKPAAKGNASSQSEDALIQRLIQKHSGGGAAAPTTP